MKVHLLNICGKTDTGIVRDHNEDNILVLGPFVNETEDGYYGKNIQASSKGVILMVADGMGGANAGEIASDLAKSILKKNFQQIDILPPYPSSFLKQSILEVHNAIRKEARGSIEFKGMGTTLIICWLINNLLHVAWVGDSRCYILDPDQSAEFTPFTDDHSLVWNLVKAGELSAEQARIHEQSNIILQSLGGDLDKPEPDYKKFHIRNGCRILICSDGLNGMLSDQGIQQILSFEKDTCNACHKLIQAAKNAGGKDNISVIIMDVMGKTTKNVTEKPASNQKKKSVFKWFILFFFFSFLFLIVYLLDQNRNSGVKTDSSNYDTISQPKSSLSLPPTKKKENTKPAQSRSTYKAYSQTQKSKDSIRILSTQIRQKLQTVEKALDGGIKEVDNLQYKKINFKLQNLKKQIVQQNLSNANVRSININRQIVSRNEVLTKLDSLETEINKANKLTKLNEM